MSVSVVFVAAAMSRDVALAAYPKRATIAFSRAQDRIRLGIFVSVFAVGNAVQAFGS